MKRIILTAALLFVFLTSQASVFAAPNYNHRVVGGGMHNSVRRAGPVAPRPPVRPTVRYTQPRTNVIYIGNTRPYYSSSYYSSYHPDYYYSYPATLTTRTVVVSQPPVVYTPSVQPIIINGVAPVSNVTPYTPYTQTTPVAPIVMPQQQVIEEPVPLSYIQPAYGETITTTIVTDNREPIDKVIDRTGKVVGIAGVAGILGLGIAALVKAL